MLETTRRSASDAVAGSATAPTMRVLHGASLFADHPVVVLDWSEPEESIIAWHRLFATLSELGIALEGPQLAAHASPDGTVSLRQLIACLAQWLDHRGSQPGIPPLAVNTSRVNDRSAVAAWFLDETRTAKILEKAWAIATIACDRCRQTDTPPPAPHLVQAVERLCAEGTLPKEMGQEFAMFHRVARKRGIVSHLLPDTKKVLLLGEGCHGRLLQSTTNDRDSSVGTTLANDKFMSNAFVARLGLPAVAHVLVMSDAVAAEAAAEIGFPLVVKPVNNGKGNGVFTGITSVEECAAAIRHALPLSTKGVLVERQVAGDDHRLTVNGGRLAWAVARRAAAVTGDGTSTIEQLIDRENARRRALSGAAKPFQTMIVIDAEMTGHLAKAGLAPQSVPAAGRVVTLRGISNVSKGGTYEDVSDRVHPDNRALAETVAAAFRMDMIGIDYMTTDITRSWRDVGGAVIEVNQTPAAGTVPYVNAALAHLFPDPQKVRVPYAIFVDDHAGRSTAAWVAQARAQGYRVGYLDASTTAVDGDRRGHVGQTPNQRMLSLILDPRVSLLVARLTSDEIAREGLLREVVDKAFLGAGVSPEVERLVRSRCRDVLPLPAQL